MFHLNGHIFDKEDSKLRMTLHNIIILTIAIGNEANSFRLNECILEFPWENPES